MVLLYPDGERWRLPLTLRPDYLPNHGGQISFPGGQIEPGESIEEAALRELHEELGTVGDGLRVLGRLSTVYVFGSNFLVTPTVAAVDSVPKFQPCASEVADLLTPSLDELCAPQASGTLKLERRGVSFNAPCIRHEHHCIWGATNMILAEFLAILKNASS
jgi:8-oxo-dGTP pyrophosphatase MutT (NUDIX family)